MENYFRKNILENHFVIALAILGLAVLIWEIKGIITAIFFSYIVAAALNPAVDFLTAHKIKHEIAAGLVFLGLILGVVIIIIPLVPFIISQTNSLIDNFPAYLGMAANFFGLGMESINITEFVKAEFNSVGKNAFVLTSKAFSGIFYFTTVIILMFYFLLDQTRMRTGLADLFGQNNKTFINNLILDINRKLGLWVRGQIVLSFAIGLASWLSLTILQVPYAFPLAVIAGILEAIPTIGPTLSAIPAVIIALSISPGLAVTIVVLYIVIQLLENNILVPNIMRQAVGLNPIAVILAIMVGSSLMGVIGALLAIPTVLVVERLANRQQTVPKI